MRNIFSLLLLIAATVLGAAERARADDIAGAARSVVRVAVVVETKNGAYLAGHGSGFAVAPNLIVTSAHVVAAGGQTNVQIAVVPSQGRDPLVARILDYAPDIDLALLQTDVDAVPAATLSAASPPSGAAVVALGYPGALDAAFQRNADAQVRPLAPEATRGWISSVRPDSPFGPDVPGLTHSAAIGRGSSGGPLVDECGRIIGINSAQSASEQGDAEFAFATAAPVVVAYLRRLGVAPMVTSVACVSDAERTRLALVASEARVQAAQAQAEAEQQRAEADRAALEDRLTEEVDARQRRFLLTLVLGALALGSGWLAFRQARRRDPVGAIASGLVLLAASGGAVMINQDHSPDEKPQNNEVISISGTPLLQAGTLACRLVREESRITLVDASDLHFPYDGQSCINGTTAYAKTGETLTRTLLSKRDRSISVMRLDLASGRFVRDHYLLDADRFAIAENEAKPVLSGGLHCNDPEVSARVDSLNRTLESLLPPNPTQHLVWSCKPSR